MVVAVWAVSGWLLTLEPESCEERHGNPTGAVEQRDVAGVVNGLATQSRAEPAPPRTVS